MRRLFLGIATLLGVAAAGGGAHSSDTRPVEHHAERRIERDGLRLELLRLQTDQTRAFLIARGFSRADADHAAATSCMFRAAIGNAFRARGEPDLTIVLTEWRVLPAGGGAPLSLLTREHWERVWAGRKASEEAAVAFHWALFPTEQVFAPSDHNWGFLSFGLTPASRFSLDVSWRSGAAAHRAKLDDLECAP